MPGEMKERFKMIIKEFHEKELPELIQRLDVMDFSMLNSRLKKIVTIVGPRRAGKTYFLYQIMKEILQGSAAITDILYVNFEDERITPIKAENLQDMLDAYFELYDRKASLCILDEVQTFRLGSVRKKDQRRRL
jgi:predicted AAA+ superfamily ATPase